MPQTRTDSVLALNGFPPLVLNVPPNWPTRPDPNKLSLLWQFNYHQIYHKYSPFTNFHDSLLGGILPDKQPFVYTFIDEAGNSTFDQLPSTVKTLASAVNINNDTLNDVVRIGKFLISSHGIEFLGTQALIQRLQPFDETRIYNPLSPILSTIQPLTLGLGQPPTRHIEGGLLGLANSVTSIVGINLQNGYQTPSSTAGNGALPDFNTGEGKGLIRGNDASKGYAQLKSTWPVSSNPSNPFVGGITGMLSMITSAATQLFGSTPRQPIGTIFRADETTYGMMAVSPRLSISQPWFPSSQTRADQPQKSTGLLTNINTVTLTALNIISNPTSLIGAGLSSLFGSSNGNRGTTFTRKKIIASPGGFLYINISSGINGQQIKGRSTGYSINDGDKYSNDVGQTTLGDFGHSDMLVQFSYYADSNQKYDSKFTDPVLQKVQDVTTTLQQVLSKINTPKVYSAQTNTYSKLLSSGDPKSIGYDNLFGSIPSFGDTVTNPNAVRQEYRNSSGTPPTIDKSINFSNNLRFATSFASDGINQLGILKKNKMGDIEIPYNAALNTEYNGWTKYQPYKDDLIAFFFYDVVNQKYIPFRATIKAISEGNTAFWDELRFIGRADQLYSYNGFSRTLSFNFNVVINSINELLPSWKKINYLASVTKPSNYTRSETINGTFNRFIVPPMFMITIGDLYKYQPIVIRSVNINIPEDATWETLNENNSNEWSYLNGKIKSNFVGKNYGQLPREVEISIEGALLEKERAVVGGSHFGHSPRKDNWEDFLDNTGWMDENGFNVGAAGTEAATYLPVPSDLHEQLVEINPPANPSTPSSPKSTGNGLDHLNSQPTTDGASRQTFSPPITSATNVNPNIITPTISSPPVQTPFPRPPTFL